MNYSIDYRCFSAERRSPFSVPCPKIFWEVAWCQHCFYLTTELERKRLTDLWPSCLTPEIFELSQNATWVLGTPTLEAGQSLQPIVQDPALSAVRRSAKPPQ